MFLVVAKKHNKKKVVCGVIISLLVIVVAMICLILYRSLKVENNVVCDITVEVKPDYRYDTKNADEGSIAGTTETYEISVINLVNVIYNGDAVVLDLSNIGIVYDEENQSHVIDVVAYPETIDLVEEGEHTITYVVSVDGENNLRTFKTFVVSENGHEYIETEDQATETVTEELKSESEPEPDTSDTNSNPNNSSFSSNSGNNSANSANSSGAKASGSSSGSNSSSSSSGSNSSSEEPVKECRVITITDEEAYVETVCVDYIKCGCGEIFNTYEEWKAHNAAMNAEWNDPIQHNYTSLTSCDFVEHPAVTHTETVCD